MLGSSNTLNQAMESIQDKAILFVYIVRQRFINQPSKYDEFVRVIASVRAEQNHSPLISKLETLFAGDHPDLLYGLNEFIPKKHEAPVIIGIQRDGTDDDMTKEEGPPTKKQCTRKQARVLSESELFNKVRDRCIEKNDDDCLVKFSMTICAYKEKKITLFQADTIFNMLFKDDPDLFLESNRVLAQSLEEPIKISGYDAGQEKSGTVVCSLHEETMDVKEFYLFETSLALSRLESTIKKLEEDPKGLNEGFTALDFRCIKKLYDDSDNNHSGLGEEMVEILKSDPTRHVAARVVVLEQLREKKKQLEKQKLHLDKIWDEIFEDIREKGSVQRHREFLRRTKKASINGFGTKKGTVQR